MSLPKIYSSIACNLNQNLLSAAYPLLANEQVAALEWSFDTLYKLDLVPGWFKELLQVYSDAGRLVGHSVFFSLFSGRWSKTQQKWLDDLRETSREFHFDHITEHFGFMTGRNFHQGAPMPVPYTANTLALGQDRLMRIQDAACSAVGLENLAFSYCLEEVKRHGEFLDKLVAPVNGFIILDLHNFYCQACNFLLDHTMLLKAYPLHLVREIHISGGSWDMVTEDPLKKIRRDTHDGAVPEAVFTLLDTVIDQCSALKYVVLEQLGTSLDSPESQAQFRADFLQLDTIVSKHTIGRAETGIDLFTPPTYGLPAFPVEDENLHRQQQELSAILETAGSVSEAMQRLRLSELHQSNWEIDNWQPYMLETALRIAKKWKNGFS